VPGGGGQELNEIFEKFTEEIAYSFEVRRTIYVSHSEYARSGILRSRIIYISICIQAKYAPTPCPYADTSETSNMEMSN